MDRREFLKKSDFFAIGGLVDPFSLITPKTVAEWEGSWREDDPPQTIEQFLSYFDKRYQLPTGATIHQGKVVMTAFGIGWKFPQGDVARGERYKRSAIFAMWSALNSEADKVRATAMRGAKIAILWRRRPMTTENWKFSEVKMMAAELTTRCAFVSYSTKI